MSNTSNDRPVPPVVANMERDLDIQRRRRLEQAGNNVNPRDRLFHALFIKIGNMYSRIVPKRFRIILEAIVLLKGLLLFTFLSYLHFSFGRAPMHCLNATLDNWPRDGILRVQIQPGFGLKKQLPRFFSPKENMVLFHPCHNNKLYSEEACHSMSADMKEYYRHKDNQFSYRDQCYRMNLSDFLFQRNDVNWKKYQDYEYVVADRSGALFKGFIPGEIINEGSLLAFYEKYLAESVEAERHYIFEYSQEFGFLRLSQETRKRLKIPVRVITLDPTKEACLGDKFSRFLLKYFLGYDDVLMNSIKKVADAENNTGYMLNVVTGDHYKFVPWGIGRGSYVISLLLMFLFTISISTLLRYCHQQVFFFIINVLQMLDMNIVLAFPIAPLFTVVLSLVGMETIMSEYFNDTTTSFYIILIVWAVDQFDTICCHTVMSQKYWLRFFYLYHFLFYAYHYRFNGQYSSLALAATWFLIQHSMLYFFHNYELPAIENNPHNARRDEEAYLDEAVQMIVEGIEMVSGQQHAPTAPEQPNQPPENADQPQDQPEGSTRVREISNGANRIFIFAADRPFIQMVRDFIHHIQDRMNAERTETPPVEEGEINPDRSVENQAATAVANEPATENTLVENINSNVQEVVSLCVDNVIINETINSSAERETNNLTASCCELPIDSPQHEELVGSDINKSNLNPLKTDELCLGVCNDETSSELSINNISSDTSNNATSEYELGDTSDKNAADMRCSVDDETPR
ncbi:membralin-like [Hydractinia symbiolongicarpus]|uniref:membralin-like n=1 Tax=Hydractinia symbiolongicarpus TaxID=13093 RepID=UPI00254B4526|nr:membralin-like [Hydractinia symbiolongicarpus]XP_057300169.1 membralin-like [Hydractinia symbiolongicarpus]XP_057300170.1 membralin-like [Hydractinia symbiolongicarpus]